MLVLLLILLTTSSSVAAAAASPPAYNATDLILLSCGESINFNDYFDREWSRDDQCSSYDADAESTASRASFNAPTPYQNACVIRLPFTYTFPVTAGKKFLRLYFYPDVYYPDVYPEVYPNVYSGFNTSRSLFSLTVNAFTLFTNFSAFLYSKNSRQSYFSVEFVVSVGGNQTTLNLTFSPNSNSFAFINGIEIISMPDKLYFRGTADGAFNLRNDTALENLYRLNIGGRRVDIRDDSGNDQGMFRVWSVDDDYIAGAGNIYAADPSTIHIKYTDETPPYCAPAMVYTSARVMAARDVGLEWLFPVDSGFHYLLRLHFCEYTTLGVTAPNQRVFIVSINFKIMESAADVIHWAGGPDIPVFRDYITWVPDDGRRGKQQLRLSLFPYLEGSPKFYSALLNGLEIFKLSDSNRSLAAANPELEADSQRPPPAVLGTSTPLRNNKSRGSATVVYAFIGSVVGALAVVAAITFLILRRRGKNLKDSAAATTVTKSSTASTSTVRPCFSLPSDLCRYFTIDEIKSATRNFDDSFIIGKGGFGNVYRGLIDTTTTTTVAIKRLNPSSNQGAREFLTEMEMLSKLRHLHLVSLIGYCDDGDEMILVYDYMAHGALRDHLYNSDKPPLPWAQRLQICMGAAAGLHYLHSGAIIHRDVKSTNILLDENWSAKIADFGLSKMGQENDSFTHISTNVKGTFGYLDPKYLSSHQLTRKSDVYAFGVVLFEVVSGRAAVDMRLEEEQHSLAWWARHCIREGEVDRLIDPNLMGQISAACFKVFVGIAGRCIHIQPLERPTMADVVMGLELALSLQQTTESAQEDDDAGVYCGQKMPS